MNKKLFVFGIDGAMPEKIFNEWLDDLPNIKKLMNGGCYAKLNSCVPPISITAWTSITTGKNPADHSIFEIFYKDKQTNKIRLVSANNVKEKRIWEVVAENNKKAISCFVPLTYPPKPYDGILVSGSPTPPEENLEVTYPKEVKQELVSILKEPLLLDIQNFRNLSKKDIVEKMYYITKLHLDSIKHLIQNKEWELFFTAIKSSDRMNHSFWKYCDELHREYSPDSEFKETLKEYYKFLDKELGEIIKLLPEDTTTIILSDHGITRMHTRINVSDWLIQEGYLTLKEEIREPVALEMDMIDWDKTKAYTFGSYDCQIYINDTIEKDKKQELIQEIEYKLKEIKGDRKEELNTRVFKKEDHFNGKFKKDAPDIIVYFDDLEYGSNTTRVGNPGLYSKQTAKGSDNAAHSKQGIFIMDKSVQKGDIGEIDIIDVFPTILKLLEIKAPEDIKGKAII